VSARIIERGRGPEIEGTRVTVYRIMDFLSAGVPPERIAVELALVEEQVCAAITYIDSNRAQVESAYAEIVERAHRSNPEWVESKLARTPQELKSRLESRFDVTAGQVDPS
jgi:uncharacterized protein (DUF433 family)